MPKYIASLTVIPIGTKSTSLSRYVALVIKALKENRINHELTPMSTVIYSDNLDEVLRAIKISHNALRNEGLDRIVIEVNIDARHDKIRESPSDKVKAVLERIS